MKNHQGRLGSYQAFAAVAMVESLHRIKTAKLDPFMLGQLLVEWAIHLSRLFTSPAGFNFIKNFNNG